MPHPYKCYFEITRQAETLAACISAIYSRKNDIVSFYQGMQPDEVLFIGCTSPYYVGKSVAYYWQSTLGVPVQAATASEYVQFPYRFHSARSERPLLVAISRSGRTSETLWAIEDFERRFPKRTVLITCASEAPMAKLSSLTISLPQGMEETLAQTRSFSAMYLAAQMMCALIGRQGAILGRLEQAPALVDKVVRQSEPVIRGILDREIKNIFVIGSGPHYGIALDGALKMMEMSLSEVMCFPFLESRHGPKSIIGAQSLVVGLCSRAGQAYEAQVMREYTTKHAALTVAVTPDSAWATGDSTLHIPIGCDWPDPILGLLYLPVLQLMAYYRALAKGVNPDQSRNLTQFVELARVVTSQKEVPMDRKA